MRNFVFILTLVPLLGLIFPTVNAAAASITSDIMENKTLSFEQNKSLHKNTNAPLLILSGQSIDNIDSEDQIFSDSYYKYSYRTLFFEHSLNNQFAITSGRSYLLDEPPIC